MTLLRTVVLMALGAAVLALSGCGANESALRPGINVQNQTALDVTVTVSGQVVATVARRSDPIEIEPDTLPPMPWPIEVRTSTGRVVLSLLVESHDVSETRGPNGESELLGKAARIDLSCGRLDVWVGPPLAGPPPEPGLPGDCEP